MHESLPLKESKYSEPKKQTSMKNYLAFLLIVILSLFLGCSDDVENKHSSKYKGKGRDLAQIKKDGKLRALTTYSSTSYFLYRGQPMGFEYELLQRFAEYLDVELEIVISKNIDSMIHQLNHGNIDLIAHGLTITADRQEQVNFTDYLYLTHQVLVQKKPDNWRKLKWSALQKALVHDAIELIGDTVSVRRNSSYYKRLQNLQKEIGGEIVIDVLPGNLSTDEIIKNVVDGEIKYTVADNNIAHINQSYYPILNIEVPISFSQRVAWATKPGANELNSALNEWLQQVKDEVVYYVIYNKYFKSKRNFAQRTKSEFFSLNNNKISKYDPLIKKYADSIHWDWRLLASLVYQESRFRPNAKSWAKAKGLMQLMPATARELGVTDRTHPEQNIRGGTKYLRQLWNRFEQIPDSVQRLKFTMAAYNCGYYHVVDAQALAHHKNLDPQVWDNHVEEMILALSYPKNYNQPFVKYGYVRGIEPQTYVKQIFERYAHYVKFIE